MTLFVQAQARTPYRIGAVFDLVFGAMATAGTYTLTRLDGVGTLVAIVRAFNTDTLAVDLVLGSPLLEGVRYVLAAAGVTGSVEIAYQTPLPESTTLAGETDDPEAEAFGVDFDWLAPAFDASGDIPTVSGRACLLHDLVTIAATERGELFHRADAGASMTSAVNGPGTDLGQIEASLVREWSRDPRVKKASARASISTTGEVSARGSIVTIPLDEPLTVIARPR